MVKIILEQAASWSRSSLSSPNPPRSPNFLAVIWQDSITSKVYASRLPGRSLNEFCHEDLDKIQVHILPAHVQPPWDPYITRYEIDVSQTDVELYLKKPRLVGYDGTMGIAQRMRQEICILEQLRKSPHPNLCSYYGCDVDSTAGLVTGVYLQKYYWSLFALLEGYTPYQSQNHPRPTLNYDTLVRGIKAGLKHLHGLGLAHNDINPSNIMVADDGTPVIIDFDNCAAFGQACRPGTPGFTNFSKSSDPRNDIHSFRSILAILAQRFQIPQPAFSMNVQVVQHPFPNFQFEPILPSQMVPVN